MYILLWKECVCLKISDIHNCNCTSKVEMLYLKYDLKYIISDCRCFADAISCCQICCLYVLCVYEQITVETFILTACWLVLCLWLSAVSFHNPPMYIIIYIYDGQSKCSQPHLFLFRIKLKYYLLLIVARLRTQHAQCDF